MEGITILNTIESTNMAPIGCYVIAGCMLGLLALTIFGIMYDNYTDSPYFIGGSFILFLMIISTWIFGPRETNITHQVLIDKSVSLVEFNEHYDIVNRQGDIYTIIEKDFSK